MTGTEVRISYVLASGPHSDHIERRALQALLPLAIRRSRCRGGVQYVLPRGIALFVSAEVVGRFLCAGPFCGGEGRHDGEGSGYCSDCEYGYDM